MRRLKTCLALVAALSTVVLVAFQGVAGAASALTLQVNGKSSPVTVATGGTITFDGTYKASAWVKIWEYTDAACTIPTNNTALVQRQADANGTYSVAAPAAPTLGTHYYAAAATVKNENGSVDHSSCVTVNVVVPAATLPPPVANVFLCYSAFQTDPGVWPATEAAALIKAGYWSPYAVPNTVTGGTNVGGYHLVCNLATGQSAGTSVLGGAGEVYGAGATADVTNVPGHYTVVGP